MCAVTVYLALSMAVGVLGRSLISPTDPQSLLHVLHLTVDSIPTQNSRLDADVTTTAPVPGRMNVCDNLCPKWCETVAGSADNYTQCHYVCGNVCNGKPSSSNPYVGDPRYEVVPSNFHFERYDVNEDKFITQEEFVRIEGINNTEAGHIFQFADLNGDGKIDIEEFRGGPFVFTVQMAVELSNMASVTQKQITL